MANTGDGDKRTVATDALETLGMIISPNEKRDAIHLAVEPIVAAMVLAPGDHVKIDHNGKAVSTPVGKGLGIVDPFLTDLVQEGQMFWLVVYPRQIKSLRHVWEHDAFPASRDTDKVDVNPEVNPYAPNFQPLDSEEMVARERISEIASGLGMDYDELMSAAENYGIHNDYLVQGGRFEGMSVPDEFWTHYYIIKKEPYQNHGNFLSCSC